ncbi:YycH family regulatory protein [Lactobacillus panisapium]|nr:hypothetical protein [Lactobacillus panisapium]
MIGMKSRFKFSDILLSVGTFIVFALSIVLWIFIMTNDQYFSRIDQTNNVSQNSRSRRSRIIYNLYLPTSAYGFKNGQPYRLYDAKKNLPLEYIKDLKEVKYKNIREVSSNQKEYEAMLNDPKYLQLTFPNEVSVNLFTKKNLKSTDQTFRRSFISPSNDVLYLGNDKTTTIYRVEIANANFNRLREYAAKSRAKKPVKFVRMKNSYETFYDQPENWRVYSYLTNTQTDSYFVSRLLGTANVTSSNNKKGWTTYSLNYYTKLRVPDTKAGRHDMLYTRYEKQKNLSENDCLIDSVEYVHKLGLSEQDLRYFDTTKDKLSYSNYIEGMPVFMGKHSPQVSTKLTQDTEEVAFSNLELQIPIPFDGQTRTLPATGTVIQRLVNAGLKKTEIQRIIVAYRIEKDHSHDSLVNLIPTYYIKAYDQWKSAQEWEKQDFNKLAVKSQGEGK